jgi:hypothetical protein
MRTRTEIQDIERMRQRVGIDDVELREQVRRLRVGDLVKLTFLAGPEKSETLRVRVTSIRAERLRGVLLAASRTPELAGLCAGSQVTFTRDHIHSVLSTPRQE